MSKRLAKVVKKLSTPHTVTIRNAVTWVNGRPTGNGELVAIVSLGIQRVTAKPIMLQRLPDGDQTEGQTRLWVALENLDKAYEEGDVDKTPLNLTELPTAPPERSEGPPGALVDDGYGRRYEVTKRLGWNESGSFTIPGNGQFQRYEIEERGATP